LVRQAQHKIYWSDFNSQIDLNFNFDWWLVPIMAVSSALTGFRFFQLPDKITKCSDNFVKASRVDAIINLYAIHSALNQVTGFQFVQVLANGGTAQGQFFGNIPADAGTRFDKVIEDSQSGRMRQRLEVNGCTLQRLVEQFSLSHSCKSVL
jgi:hypothetical protein